MLANLLFLLTAATSTIVLGGTRPLDATSTIRLETIQQELQSAGVPSTYLATLLIDPRLAVSPPPIMSTSTTTSTPPKPIDWDVVRANLITKKNIAEGKKFIAANLPALKKAETTYGVSRYSIAALMGMETRFGSITGRTPVFSYFLNSTLNASSKWDWPKTNMVALVSYCYESNIDCLTIKGSTSGAIGWSQFLPHSIDQWGKDGDRDGIINLFSGPDSILSTANFLKQHGWKTTTASRLKALAGYYGSSTGYPDIVLDYGQALKR